jgi:hypothetical protein
MQPSNFRLTLGHRHLQAIRQDGSHFDLLDVRTLANACFDLIRLDIPDRLSGDIRECADIVRRKRLCPHCLDNAYTVAWRLKGIIKHPARDHGKEQRQQLARMEQSMEKTP